MSDAKEKKKQLALGIIFLVFVMTAYVTFFKDTPKKLPPPPDSGGQVIRKPDGSMPGFDIKEVHTTVPGSFSEKEPDRIFQETIRDIFQVPGSIKKISSQKTAAGKKALSQQEREAVKASLIFKGAILHNSRSVAIINQSFFHIGDRIKEFKVMSISEKQVEIASTRGKINLEIINYD